MQSEGDLVAPCICSVQSPLQDTSADELANGEAHVRVSREVRSKRQRQYLTRIRRSDRCEDAPWKTAFRQRPRDHGISPASRSNSPTKRLSDRLKLHRHAEDRYEREGNHHDHPDYHRPPKTDSLDHDSIQQGAEERACHARCAERGLPLSADHVRAIGLLLAELSFELGIGVEL